MEDILVAIRTCSHDIRNSLTVIRANVSRVQRVTKNIEDERLAAGLASIDARVDRIVEDLERLYKSAGIKKG